jgi:hypothetical protein
LFLQITGKAPFRPAIPLKTRGFIFGTQRESLKIPLFLPDFDNYPLLIGQEQQKTMRIQWSSESLKRRCKLTLTQRLFVRDLPRRPIQVEPDKVSLEHPRSRSADVRSRLMILPWT